MTDRLDCAGQDFLLALRSDLAAGAPAAELAHDVAAVHSAARQLLELAPCLVQPEPAQ